MKQSPIESPNKGKLILFPVGLGQSDLSTCLPEHNRKLLNSCQTFIVENVREARRFLSRYGYSHSIDETRFYELNEHTKLEETSHFLEEITEGNNVGILSDAGLPCIADPGSYLVALAQKKGIEVIPLVGPSSLFLALMASGFNGQNFSFLGYLPIETRERENTIHSIENELIRKNQTFLFIETPYRNKALYESLLRICRKDTLLCLATDILLDTQKITSHSIKEWKKKEPDIHKRNTVFLLHRG